MRGTFVRAAGWLLAAALVVVSTGCEDGSSGVQASPAPARASAAVMPSASSPTKTMDPALLAAVQSYRTYLDSQAKISIKDTRAFTDAVRAGNLDLARKRFAPSRAGWQRILWLAFYAPDLDRRLDARADEFASPTDPRWTGWHRFEHALWVSPDTPDLRNLADRLDHDVNELPRAAAAVHITPSVITTAAQRLVEDAAADKLTGAEDRYSGTDLWDVAGNVEGATAAYSTLRPALEARDPKLARLLDQRFTAMTRALAPYRTATGYRPYRSVTGPARADLQARVEALAESVSALVSAFQR